MYSQEEETINYIAQDKAVSPRGQCLGCSKAEEGRKEKKTKTYSIITAEK